MLAQEVSFHQSGIPDLLSALAKSRPARHVKAMLIYKIFRRDEHEAFSRAGETKGAPVDLADGYIHFSTAETVAVTAAKHFNGEDGLKLLAVKADSLGDALIWEVSRGGVDFPHLYRPLRREDVLWTRDLPLRDGRHRFEGLLP